MTSHEYALELLKIAHGLQERPEFPLPDYYTPEFKAYLINISYFADKKRFLQAVAAIGSAVKGGDESNYVLTPAFAPMLRIEANRNAVCRIVKPATPAEYECEPLLSQAEEAQVG